MTGAVGAAWSTRIPAIKEGLGLADGALGAAILGLEAGAIVGLPAGGALVARTGSPWALRIGFTLFPLGLFTVSLARHAATLGVALAAMAAATSVIDVAMNAQGVELERRYGRPVLSSMHAGHPFGLVAGGVFGTVAAASGVPVRTHFALTAVAGVLAGVGATWWLVRERGPDGGPAFARPSRPLVLLGLVAFGAFLLDGAAYNWSAVHLRNERGADPGLAAAAFTLFSLALAIGRLGGDRLVARFGRVRVVQGWPSPRPRRRRRWPAGWCSGSGWRRSRRPCSAPRRRWPTRPPRWRSRRSRRSATSARSPARPRSARSPR